MIEVGKLAISNITGVLVFVDSINKKDKTFSGYVLESNTEDFDKGDYTNCWDINRFKRVRNYDFKVKKLFGSGDVVQSKDGLINVLVIKIEDEKHFSGYILKSDHRTDKGKYLMCITKEYELVGDYRVYTKE